MEMDEGGAVAYDMSFSTNSRINYLLWKCNQSLEQENAFEWFKCLKNLYKEISPRVEEEELKEYEKEIKLIKKEIDKYQNFILASQNIKNVKIPETVFELLYDWEIVIRHKLNDLGLLFKDRDVSAF